MRATIDDNTHHAVRSTKFVVFRVSTALDTKVRSPRAGGLCATPRTDVYRALFGIVFAVHHIRAALKN